MAANTYDKGDRVTVTTSTVFQDSGGNAFDPATVTFRVRVDDGDPTDYVYDQDDPQNQDAAITKNGTGDYTLTIDVDVGGGWYVRVYGEEDDGENRGADEIYFKVLSGEF